MKNIEKHIQLKLKHIDKVVIFAKQKCLKSVEYAV